jgi:hypothetical protein
MSQADERGILRIDSIKRRRLRAILEYLKSIHHHIDPDMFEIDPGQLESMLDPLGGDGLEETRLGVTYRDLLFLEIAIDAAGTYAERRDFPSLDDVDDDDLAELHAWLAAEENALFRTPPTIH